MILLFLDLQGALFHYFTNFLWHKVQYLKGPSAARIDRALTSVTVVILTFALTIKGRTYDLIESSLDRDKFMSPEEALEFGLIDKILEHPPKLGHDDEKKKEEPTTKWYLNYARLCCAYVYLQKSSVCCIELWGFCGRLKEFFTPNTCT